MPPLRPFRSPSASSRHQRSECSHQSCPCGFLTHFCASNVLRFGSALYVTIKTTDNLRRRFERLFHAFGLIGCITRDIGRRPPLSVRPTQIADDFIEERTRHLEVQSRIVFITRAERGSYRRILECFCFR